MILICCWPRVPFAIQCLSGVTERPILTIVFNITGLRLATGKLKIRVGQKIKIVSKLSHQDYLFLVNGIQKKHLGGKIPLLIKIMVNQKLMKTSKNQVMVIMH